MSLYQKLLERRESGDPIRVGVIGAGKFGSMFLSQSLRIPGIQVVGICDIAPKKAKSNLDLIGWSADSYDAVSLDSAAQSGSTWVGEDAAALVSHHSVDIIVDCTGNPVIAVDHLLDAFRNGKNVVSATVEADAVCGAALAKEAKSNGVLYSMAYGDQPAMVCELVDWARTCGFNVVAAGRGHKWHPKFRKSTPDTIWDNWGVTAEHAERGRLNPKMFNSFLDGTKPAIESAAIANACGLDAPSQGLTFPVGSAREIPNLMRPKSVGGKLETSGMVEVINSMKPDGSLHEYDIRQGVWVCVEAADDYQHNCFSEYMVNADDSGKFFALYKRWHLIGLELGMSVASVALRGETTGTASVFRADVVAVAKKDLAPGDIMDGEGGYCVAGQLRPTSVSVPMGAFPLGLTDGAKIIKPVKADEVLTYDHVVFDENTNAAKLRRQLETAV